MGMDVEIPAGTQDILAEQIGGARLGQGTLEALIDLEDLAVDVVVAGTGAQGVAGDDHALDQLVRIEAQDVAVLEGARLALVRVADDVLVARKLTRHEAPLQAGREAGAATAAQGALLDLLDDLLGRGALGQDLLQGLVTAVGEIGLERGRFGMIQRPEANLGAHFSSSNSLSTDSGVRWVCILWLLCRQSGPSPQAPMHSPSTRV